MQNQLIVPAAKTVSSKNFGDMYEKIKDLGEGGYGQVGLYRQRDQLVAVKSIPTTADFYQTYTLVVEATVMQHLRGIPGIPKFYGLFVISDRQELRLVIEFIEGMDLNKYSRVTPEPELLENFKSIFEQLTEEVLWIHRKGVIHGDIKPHNVMYSKGKVYLIDYGIACFYDEQVLQSLVYQPSPLFPADKPGLREKFKGMLFCQEKVTSGTCGFIPNDVILSKIDRTRISGTGKMKLQDIFAIGVTMYAYLFHKLPYGAARIKGSPYLCEPANAILSFPQNTAGIFLKNNKLYQGVLRMMLEQDLNTRATDALLDMFLKEVNAEYKRNASLYRVQYPWD